MYIICLKVVHVYDDVVVLNTTHQIIIIDINKQYDKKDIIEIHQV